ncbi:MAG: hypothetical protein LBE08_01425 [Bifidobacteriaceae bacterium]|nr:hypothetical protein [Bifidobacteriaceae bacterium]
MRSQPVRRHAAAGLTLALVALGASGCMRVEAEFIVHADDTAEVTTLVVYQDAALEALSEPAGMTPESYLSAAGFDAAGLAQQAGPDAQLEPYAAAGYSGWTISGVPPVPFADAELPLGVAGSLALARVGDEIRLTGEVNLTAEEFDFSNVAADPALAAILDEPQARLVFVFPGAVQSANGSIDGNRVTFDVLVGEVTQIEAVAAAPAAPNPAVEPSTATNPPPSPSDGPGQPTPSAPSTAIDTPPIILSLVAIGTALLGVALAVAAVRQRRR